MFCVSKQIFEGLFVKVAPLA